MFLAKRTAWIKAQRYAGGQSILEMNIDKFGLGGNNAKSQNSHICSLEVGQGREDNLEESLELFL